MQRAFQFSTLAALLALAGCNGDSDETPDITEAIPLDIDEPMPAGDADATDTGASNPSDSSDTPALPGSSNANAGENNAANAQRERLIPDTMEAGSNPADFEIPKGSKVQRPN